MSLALTGCASSCVVLRLIIKFRGNSSRVWRKRKRASGVVVVVVVVFRHLALRSSSAADDECFVHAVQDETWPCLCFLAVTDKTLSFLSLWHTSSVPRIISLIDCVRLRSLQLEIFTRRYLFVGKKQYDKEILDIESESNSLISVYDYLSSRSKRSSLQLKIDSFISILSLVVIKRENFSLKWNYWQKHSNAMNMSVWGGGYF